MTKKLEEIVQEREIQPLFPIGVACQFFDKSPYAFRWYKYAGHEVDLQDRPLDIHRTPGGQLRYSLQDLRYIAHACRRHGGMNNRALKVVISRLDAFRIPLYEKKWYTGTEATLAAQGERQAPERWSFPPVPWKDKRYDYLD